MKRLQQMLIATATLALLGFGIFSSAHGQGGSDAPLTADLPTASAKAVTIDNFSFSPADITVPAGTTLTWTNRDDIPHTVPSTSVRCFWQSTRSTLRWYISPSLCF